MREEFKKQLVHDPTVHDPRPARQRGTFPRWRAGLRRYLRSYAGFRLIIALSVLVYLALTGLIIAWLPNYPLLALVPALLALHSVSVLLSRRKE
jgi:hypothetical protein